MHGSPSQQLIEVWVPKLVISIAGRFRGLFSEFRSDWEWSVQTFPVRGYRHNFCCHRDFCHKDLDHPARYADWTEDAFWVSTSWTHEQYMETVHAVTALASMPGWRLERTLADSMHCTNLGISWPLISSVLWFLCMRRAYLVLGPPRVDAINLPNDAGPTQVLVDLSVRFKIFCSNNKFSCSFPRFTMANLHLERGCQTPSYNCKASKSDKIVGWLAFITRAYATLCQDPVSEAVATCVWGMATYYNITKRAGHFLEEDERKSLWSASRAFLENYTALHKIGICPEKPNLFALLPKHHQFDHIIRDCLVDGVNPARFTCFVSEDMVGRALELTSSCHPLTSNMHAMQRYKLLLFESWQDEFIKKK